MSEITHFKTISIVHGDIKVNINLDRFSEQFKKAQDTLDSLVLQDCKSYMPLATGLLQDRSYIEGPGRVVFPGPYARFLYMGKVMVDPDTGSPWAKKDAKKVLTDRNLTYGRPEATSHWFDTAKAQYGEYWIKTVKEIGGGG